MSDYYLDGGAATNGTGTQVSPFNVLQSAVDATSAGDTIFAKGTQVLSAKVNLSSSHQGNTTSGMTRLIGCNSTWVNDGTKFVLDGDGTAENCIEVIDCDYWYLENIDAHHATSDGMEWKTTASYGWVLSNVSAHHNGGRGFDGNMLKGAVLLGCEAYLNTYHGFQDCPYSFFMGCNSHHNTLDGYNLVYTTTSVFLQCLAVENSDEGFGSIPAGCKLIQCTAHGNSGNQIDITTDRATVAGCRITGAVAGKYGIDTSSELVYLMDNYFQQNGGTDITPAATNIMIKRGNRDTNTWAGSDTDYGYEDSANGDYNLTSTATKREIDITIPD